MSRYSMQDLDRTIREVIEHLGIQPHAGDLELYGDERVYLKALLLDWYRAGQAAMRDKYESRLRAGSMNIERGPVGLEDPL